MKLGRNDPCPCGSGRKYKHCCWTRDDPRAGDRGEGLSDTDERVALEYIRAAATNEHTWAVDAVPLRGRLDDGDVRRPVSLLVTAGRFAVGTDVVLGLRGEAGDVAAALERTVAATARAFGVFPERLRVRHEEVAAALEPLVAERQITVEVAPMPELEAAARNLMVHLTGRASWPPVCQPQTWGAWDLPLQLVARLFTAAAHYYRSAPWRDVALVQAPRAVLPSARAWTCCPLGHAGDEVGLALYSDAHDFYDVVARPEVQDPYAGLRGRILSLTFETAAQLGTNAVHEVRHNHWEVAGPAAFPALVTVNTPGGGASRADIEDMIALLRAVPAFVQQHRTLLQHERETRQAVTFAWTDPESGIRFD